jgi:hypothetical protein
MQEIVIVLEKYVKSKITLAKMMSKYAKMLTNC